MFHKFMPAIADKLLLIYLYWTGINVSNFFVIAIGVEYNAIVLKR